VTGADVPCRDAYEPALTYYRRLKIYALMTGQDTISVGALARLRGQLSLVGAAEHLGRGAGESGTEHDNGRRLG